jgi:hypothetical protein
MRIRPFDIRRGWGVRAAACGLALLGWVEPSGAQTLTGAVVGTVVDSSAARLPGVTVTLTSPALIRGQQTAVSTIEGSYRFPSLPPGDYALSFELSGFRTAKREGIRVQAGQTYAVDVTLQLAGVEEQITVVGRSPLIDVKGAETDHTVGAEVIGTLPVPRRFTDLLDTLPGVTNGLYTFSPTNTVYGSSVRENVYTVDGLNFVDPVVRTAVTDVPFDDVEEVQVTTAGFNAEFGEASGGIFNFVTKSGGNTFSGTGNFHLQDKSLESSNITEELRRQGVAAATSVDHVYDWGGNLGGPIAKNRVWFFQSYHKFEQEQSQTDFPQPITIDQWQTLSKITAQLGERNRLEGSYSRRDREFLPFNFGFAVAGDRRTWIGIGWLNDAANFKWSSVLSDSSLLEVRGGFTLFDLLNLEPFLEPGTPVYSDRGTGIIRGGPDGTFGTNNRDRYDLKADLTHFRDKWLAGSHNFKFGFHWEELRSNTFRENQAAADDTHHFLLNGAPFRVRLFNTPLRQTAGLKRLAGYLQDEWTLNQRLTLSLGVRIENATGFLPESEFLGGRWQEARTFPREDDLFGDTAVAPRFGLVYDITGDRKTVVRFSAGRFYQGLSTLEVGVASPTSVGFREFDWADRNGDFLYQPGEEGILRVNTTGAVPGRIDPDLRTPFTNMVAGGIERELGADFAVSLNAIYKNEKDIVLNTDVNIPFSAYNGISVPNPLDNQLLTIYTLRPEFLGRPSQLFVTNPTDPVVPIRRYKGLEVVARKRMSNRWQMLASYNVGKAEGHQGTLFFDSGNGGGGLFTNPNNLVNAFGPTSLDRTHLFKIAATYVARYDVSFSVYYTGLSGVPWLTSQSGGAGINGARVVRFFRANHPGILSETFIDVAAEPRGSNRHDAEHKLDVRVDKTFKFRGFSLAAQVDIFNLLNANTIIRLQSLRTDAPNFLRPAQILLPRAARIGFRVTF